MSDDMQAQPARKISEIVDKSLIMENALRKGAKLDDLAWERLKNALVKLYDVSSERSIAAVFLAVAYSFKADSVEVERYSSIAMRLGVESVPAFTNLYFAAVRVGSYSFADSIFLDAENQRMPLEVNSVISMQMQMGKLIRACELIESNTELLGAMHTRNADELRQTADYMIKHDLTDSDLSKRIQVAHRCFTEMTRAAIYNCVIEPTQAGILFGIPFAGSDDEGEAIDWAIAEAINEQFDESLGEHISVVTYPMDAVKWLDDTKVKLSDESVEVN
jgi:hypothetical protein